jgi:hypothetical protein
MCEELSDKDKKEINEILESLLKNSNSVHFAYPVDIDGLNLKDYFEIIKTPMDISTVRQKIEKGGYNTPDKVLDDIQLIWDNCKTYNMEGYPIYTAAVRMEKLADKLIKKSYKDYIKKSFMKTQNFEM